MTEHDDELPEDDLLAEEHEHEDEPDDAQDLADEGEDDGQDQRPRDDRGRFAPVAALQSLRKEKAELQRRLEALEKRSQPQPQPQQRDQRELSPEEQAEMRRQSERLDTLEEVARMQFTDEVVDEAQKWFGELRQIDPYAAQAILNARNPYKELITRFEQALILEEIRERGLDLTLEDVPQQPAPQRAPPQQSQAPAPRPSLASMPSSGGGAGSIRTGPGAAFDDLF